MAKAKDDPWIWSTGRRKTAVARVRMKPGTGRIVVNKQDLEQYFRKIVERQRVMAPLAAVAAEKSDD